jgi:hypothetical protein
VSEHPKIARRGAFELEPMAGRRTLARLHTARRASG